MRRRAATRSAGSATPGLNYWTFDPIVGAAYSNAKSGLNAAIHVGYAMNTENNATSYKSGDYLHVDAAVQQIFPLGSGFANIGAEAWYFQQVTCDSGSGATLGCFKGRTAGIGPVLGYIQPIGKREAALRAQVAAGAGHQEPPEGRLHLAEDGLQVLMTRISSEIRTMRRHSMKRKATSILLQRRARHGCSPRRHRRRKSCRSRPRRPPPRRG